MCNQAVSLVAAELERQGIATVALQLLRDVAKRVGPPRALFVPFRHGYPLDVPSQPARQHAVIEAALRLLEISEQKPPVLVNFEGSTL
jgi:D-proline reductase (dithiol) PrdB